MRAIRQSDGSLLIPARAESDGVLGDGMRRVEPGSPAYAEWIADAVPADEDDRPKRQLGPPGHIS